MMRSKQKQQETQFVKTEICYLTRNFNSKLVKQIQMTLHIIFIIERAHSLYLNFCNFVVQSIFREYYNIQFLLIIHQNFISFCSKFIQLKEITYQSIVIQSKFIKNKIYLTKPVLYHFNIVFKSWVGVISFKYSNLVKDIFDNTKALQPLQNYQMSKIISRKFMENHYYLKITLNYLNNLKINETSQVKVKNESNQFYQVSKQQVYLKQIKILNRLQSQKLYFFREKIYATNSKYIIQNILSFQIIIILNK
ncbi:unnamed protein product [Paramecium sonneborni]|uniref:Uncharacterized protein n=1 Tax=Paramecium sonneborni TaxID=65129 RepID=A0A8S1NV77_9CILI|nr:unnamed protein product [Paramecium sonneborni]